ncbi:hypothetical protein V1478_008545 [Vespula squamosa]|uniref:Uncharacterized protein n=1 Tax=Vespula squamosa TaxID=30214 RepID=A0ABD2ATU1_VESSQ
MHTSAFSFRYIQFDKIKENTFNLADFSFSALQSWNFQFSNIFRFIIFTRGRCSRWNTNGEKKGTVHNVNETSPPPSVPSSLFIVAISSSLHLILYVIVAAAPEHFPSASDNRSASIFCRDDDKRTEAERVKRNMRMRGRRVDDEIEVEEEEMEVEVEAEARGKSVKVLFPERMTRLVLCNRQYIESMQSIYNEHVRNILRKILKKDDKSHVLRLDKFRNFDVEIEIGRSEMKTEKKKNKSK